MGERVERVVIESGDMRPAFLALAPLRDQGVEMVGVKVVACEGEGYDEVRDSAKWVSSLMMAFEYERMGWEETEGGEIVLSFEMRSVK